MPSTLLDRLQGILPLVDKVADKIVSEETEILNKILLQMFEVTTKFSYNYVKRGNFSRWSSFLDSANADDRRENRRCAHLFKGKEMIDKVDEELANGIKDFMRAVDVRALRQPKEVVSTY